MNATKKNINGSSEYNTHTTHALTHTQQHSSATPAWTANTPAKFLPALAQRRGAKHGRTAALG